MFQFLSRWLKQTFEHVAPGHGFSELLRRTGLEAEVVESIDRSYHSFSIPKKHGGRRQILAPNKELKRLQRTLLKRLFKRLNIHPLATGFRPGVSFVDNAKIHQCQNVVIRIDLVDFFPSISSDTIFSYFRRIGWQRKPANWLTQITTHQGSLPQGAPTSPKLSNLVNYSLDCKLAKIAQRYEAVYTRYADDITFSMANPKWFEEVLEDALREIHSFGYRTHKGKKKFRVYRQHHRQLVTGLVVNEKVNLPREKRRWLRAVRHRAKRSRQLGYLGPRPTLTESQLEGWDGLEQMINPPDSK